MSANPVKQRGVRVKKLFKNGRRYRNEQIIRDAFLLDELKSHPETDARECYFTRKLRRA